VKDLPTRNRWQYRIIRDKEGGHRIAEVYVLRDGSIAWTQDPVAPYGNDFREIRADVDRMLRAFDYDPPVLIEEELEAMKRGS
jgi:hypothetical protein